MKCAATPACSVAAYFTLHMRRNSPYISYYGLSGSPRLRRATSRASSIRSATRKSARPSPMTSSGSGATRSVHCRGTEQMVVSSTCSKSRMPYALYRSATQTSCCPLRGWNGCVTRTRRVAVTVESAFWVELQAIGDRDVQNSHRTGIRSAARRGGRGRAGPHARGPGSARSPTSHTLVSPAGKDTGRPSARAAQDRIASFLLYEPHGCSVRRCPSG